MVILDTLLLNQVPNLALGGLRPPAHHLESRVVTGLKELKNTVILGPHSLGELPLTEFFLL